MNQYLFDTKTGLQRAWCEQLYCKVESLPRQMLH